GLVTNRAVTPHLTRQFTPEEHRQILDAFDGFAALPEQIGGCDISDDAYYRVTVRHDGSEQTTNIRGCALGSHGGGQGLERIRRIVSALTQLSEDISETQLPWRGLEADFSTDRQVYHPGEPITLTAHVRNTSDGARSLFFEPDTERVGFRLYRRDDGSGFSFEYPEHEAGPLSEPFDEVVFGPGEEKTFTLVWNGVVPGAEGGTETLAPGEYSLRSSLLDTSGRFYSDRIVITIVNG
ncbi:MAG TPA: hypothetical protein VFG50_09265, partial [Rhodothermales bacterium]|nr:hypothetical protein [Rhodothermales bacterium]